MTDFFAGNKRPANANNENNHIRPEPQKQDGTHIEPWFVSNESETKGDSKFSTKKVVKRTASVLFPIIGLTVIILSLALVLMYVVNIYE